MKKICPFIMPDGEIAKQENGYDFRTDLDLPECQRENCAL